MNYNMVLKKYCNIFKEINAAQYLIILKSMF